MRWLRLGRLSGGLLWIVERLNDSEVIAVEVIDLLTLRYFLIKISVH